MKDLKVKTPMFISQRFRVTSLVKRKTKEDEDEDNEYIDPYMDTLQTYLNFFFPLMDDDALSNVKSEAKKYLSTHANSTYFSKEAMMYKEFLSQQEYIETIPDYHRKELSHRFVQIMLDFFLEQSIETENGVQFNNQFTSNPDGVMACVGTMLKHLTALPDCKHRAHYYNKLVNQSLFVQVSVQHILIEPLHMSQFPLFWFLHNVFNHFPGASIMHALNHLLHIWEVFLTPWARFNEDPKAWMPYVISNYLFYSILFVDFIKFWSQHFSSFSSKHFHQVDRILAVIANPLILKELNALDYFLYARKQRQTQSNPNIMDDSSTSVDGWKMSLLLDHLNSVLGDANKYIMFYEDEVCDLAKDIINRGANKVIERRLDLQESCNSWFVRAFGMSQSDIDFEENTHALERIIINMGTIYSVDIASKIKKDSHSISRPSPLRRSLKESPFQPDLQKGKLSQKGRLQISQGTHKCSKDNIGYLGDAMYQPYTNYEIPWLVHFTLYLSEKMNVVLGHPVGPCRRPSKNRVNLRFLADTRFLFSILFSCLMMYLMYLMIVL
mmetsp:Transcript_5283/g.7794  ORF Transcript_5283/g.7794 Transcript_5283/m.7794 type:complete len:553 (+) Transcript_5283:1-1659(+)